MPIPGAATHDDKTQDVFTARLPTDTPFGTCDAGHAPLFSVRAGIHAEDALIHASLFLKCACDTANAACNADSNVRQGLLWSVLHSAEIAKALVDALLDGTEAQALKQAGDSVV